MNTRQSSIKMRKFNHSDIPLLNQIFIYKSKMDPLIAEDAADKQPKQVQTIDGHAVDQLDDNHDMGQITNWGYFTLFSYLYVIQGIVSGFAATMPYIYTQLPDTNTMTIFNSTNLPFSLKFLIAPFLEKFSFVEYGKRKTWFMFSLVFTSLVVFTSSFYTEYKYDNLFAILCILAQVGMAFLDISVHAAMVKQLKSAAQTSIVLCYSQNVGSIIGSLLMLKFTSKEFSQSIGLSQPITTPQTFLIVYACLLLVPIFIIQFYFKETVLQSERKGSRFSFCEIITYYKVFLNPSSRYFRLCIYFLFYQQGINFFTSLYDYHLVEKGFSRDTYNDIGNIIVIPVIIMTFFYARWTNYINGKANALILCFSFMIAINLYLLIVFPMTPWIIFATALATNIFSNWVFFIGAWMINEFPPHALTGMFITMNASFSNFGSLTTIQTFVSGKIGWQLCSYIGFGIQLIVILFMYRIFDWMHEGDYHVPKQIQDPQSDPHHSH